MDPDRSGMRRRQGGFTLLEAIVSLAILAAAGLALFAAMSQSVQMVPRAQCGRETAGARRNALAWSGRINPMEDPDGEHDLGGYVLRWSAVPVEPPRDATTGTRAPGLFEVGLYRMQLELWRDGVLAREASLHRAGYRQVRRPEQF